MNYKYRKSVPNKLEDYQIATETVIYINLTPCGDKCTKIC